MAFNPEIHHRRSIRLQDYDYSSEGAYFVTICVHNRECLLGQIISESMQRNDAGRMVEKWWIELERKFPSIRTDTYVVMPNHFHGIIVVVGTDVPANVGADLCVRPDMSTNPGADLSGRPDKEDGHAGPPLPTIMQWFKTMTTNEYIRSVKENGWRRFSDRLWQRNYYEHVIRNDKALNGYREYIEANPSQWTKDPENPYDVRPRVGFNDDTCENDE